MARAVLPDATVCGTSPPPIDITEDRIHRALADRRGASIDAAHSGLRGEGNKGLHCQLLHVATADAVFLLGQHHDRAPFRGLVGERGQLRRIRQFLLGDAASTGRNTVAWRLPSVMVPVLSSNKRIDVAGGFDRATGHRQHVEAYQPVHAGNADRRQQRADGGRDQRDEQRHQHHH